MEELPWSSSLSGSSRRALRAIRRLHARHGPSTAPAAAATTAQIINLSSFDKALAFFPVTSFHIFDHAIHRPAETVRSALVHYYPVAGRAVIDDGGGGELRIACTGKGVGFVAASANCSLEDIKLFDPPFGALLKELAVGLVAERFRPSDTLLLVQVTEFSCGGFVVGVTRNHVVADGTGFVQFLQAVGELARHSTKKRRQRRTRDETKRRLSARV